MSSRTVLSEDLLERCARRAAAYDRENRFFMEDFEELRQANYLLAVVPKEFGGLGLTHVEVCREQRRLARRSTPTALGINMHLLTTGIAADLWRKGDTSQVWLLDELRAAPSLPMAIRNPATTSKRSIPPREPSGSRVAIAFLATSISAR